MYIPKRKGHTAMKKNIFEETYKGIQKAKKTYNEASDKEGQETARAIYRKATESLDGLSKTEMKI